MHAETLNCPACGAAVMSDATHCKFCDARLATAACPRCLKMMFIGSRHCSHCGARVTDAEMVEKAAARPCPRCRVEMQAVTVGSAHLRECVRCNGLWVDVVAFEQICNEREQESAVLGAAALVPKGGTQVEPDKVRYVPCPVCGQLMNRVNFARCSGVIVDVCKGHGTWFDRDELQRIIDFIRGGGLEVSRSREKRELEDERRALRQEQLAAALHNRPTSLGYDREERPSVVRAAGELLKLLMDRKR